MEGDCLIKAQSEWSRCKPWIEAALEYCYGTHSIEDIEAGIEAGEFHFWPGKNCAFVTEIAQHPRMKILNLFLAGGDLAEITEMEASIIAWAKTLGCTRVIQIGRAGWMKTYRNLGYRVTPMIGAYKDL